MNNVTLTVDQEKARNAFLDFLVGDDHFFVIQGAAGTGKSFLIKHLLETFYSKYQAYCLLLQEDVQKFDIKVTATTNKAVSVVEEFLDQLLYDRSDIEVCTIFSLLGLKVVNDRKTGKTSLEFGNNKSKLSNQDGVTPLVFIDEASFISQELDEIINAVLKDNYKAKVVYIGDKYQLAPVGQTFSVMDTVQCEKATLDQIMRNGGHILDTGTQFRKTVETGKFHPILFNDQDVIHVNGPTFKQMVESSFNNSSWKPHRSRILARTNEKVQAYNAHIRKINGLPERLSAGESCITNEFINGQGFTRGVDSEVLITNVNPYDEEVYDVHGRMIELDHKYVGFMPNNYSDAKALLKSLARRKEWKKYFEIKETWLDLRPLYASTVHKAQGSTYDTVFLDLADIGANWEATDTARLLYVGITRAAKQVVCYGYLPDRYC